MKTKKILMLATAGVIIAGGLFTTKSFAADDSTAATQPIRRQILQRIAQRLNLTDDQKSQIKAILAGEKDTLKNLLGQLHDERKNLRAAIQAGDANETSVRAASAKVAAVEADFAVERMKIYAKISPVLTDQQRQQISDFEQHADDLADDAIAHLGDGLAQ
ncbi:MAG TPA: Spy/CpxP family protein refolding chaperone [Candidatus Aquilonibacter sp.]|nr:Spy/CpxP family protein refolding chaperone [Candidatus Aquilonibacter sp.]